MAFVTVAVAVVDITDYDDDVLLLMVLSIALG